MGNNESNPIRNMDKRTARREYRVTFMKTISTYRRRKLELPPECTDTSEPLRDLYWATENDQNIRVCVRKRPIFKHEVEDFEFDVVSAIGGRVAVVHDGRMHSDMRRHFMDHHKFAFDNIFDEKTNNEEVYKFAVAPLARYATVEGGYCTCLVYGQTGSGKTFTMSSVYTQAAEDVFRQLNEASSRFDAPAIVSVSFIELAGENCFDLLNAFTPAQLLAGVDGSVHAYPVVEPEVSSAEELAAMIAHGFGVRSTASTGVHDSSSRSHAILRIYIQRDANHLSGDSSVGAVHEGVLTLVDLAGSEHRIDSMHHSADRRKEGAGINASLMALKECIRARAAGQNASHQYRKSKLTMALKASFLSPSARTLIIATVSPASKDTEHTLNTLRHACIMDGQQDIEASGVPSAVKETRFVTGGTIEREECGEVDVTDVARKNMAVKKITGKDASARTSNGNEVQLLETQQPETTERQIAKNRRASERRMFSKLSPEQKVLLTAAREKLGSVQRQHERLRRCKEEAVEGNAVGIGVGVKKTALEASPDMQFSRYGGSGVQSHSITSSSHVKQHASAVDKEKEKESETEKQTRKDKKNLFTKLKSSVYSSAEGVSEALLKRQLVTLMKLNGFTAHEISTTIPPCEADDLIEPSPSPISSQGSYPRVFNQSRALENDECLSNAEAADMQTAASKSIRPGRRQSKLRITDDGSRGQGEPIVTSSRPSKIGSINSINDIFVATDSDGTAYTSAIQRTSNPLNEDVRDNEAFQKKREAAANAAAAVESSALTRKSRQEQAKSVRDKLDADKRAALLKKLGRSSDVVPKAAFSPRPRTGAAAGAGDAEDSLDVACASELSQVVSAFTAGNTSTITARTVHKESHGHPVTLDKSRVTDPLMREREKVVGHEGREVDRSRIRIPRTSNGGQEYERRGSGILRSVPLSALNALNAGTGSGAVVGVGAASPRSQAMSSGSRTPTVIVMKGQPVQYFAGDEVEQQVKALQMRGQSSGSTGHSHSSSGDRFNDYHEQARGRGSDVSYRESSSAQSNRPDSYAGEGLGRRNREAIPTNHNDVGNHEFNARPEIVRRMSKTQYDMRDNDHYYQQQQRRTDQWSNDGNDPLNHSQSWQHQWQQQQQQQQQQHLSRSLPRHPVPDPVNSQAQGAHTQGQGAPRQRLSIQEQHKLEYDQNEAYRQAQQQQQRHLQEQQQQQLIREQVQEQSRLQQQHQSHRASDLDSTLVRHLRSNPSAQRHVGAAAAPWANELTWDRDMVNDT